MKRDKAAAVVTIRGAGSMTVRTRKAIATWLRKRADDLEATGRYLAR